MNRNIMFVGTYTSNSYSEGIYSFVFDEDYTEILETSVQSECHNPAWLVLHPQKRVLYALDDSVDRGGVYSYSYDPVNGRLEFINHLMLPGAKGSCHAAVSKNGRFIIVANYYSGDVFVCALREDGGVGDIVTHVQHTGSSVRKDHQDSAHAHFVQLDASGRFATICELGADRMMLYLFDEETGALTPNPALPQVAVQPEEGPRHAVMHPSERWLYVVTELGCKILVYAYDNGTGAICLIQTIPTLRESFKGHSTAGEIIMTRDGRHILATNRWYDSIVEFDVDPETGLLSNRRFFSCMGGEPRHIALTPDEKYIAICNQDTRNLVIRPFDAETGGIEGEHFETFVWKPTFSLTIPAKGGALQDA